MSNGNSFNWLAFLLGLAIGLWISVVVLFLIDIDDHNHCCGSGGTTIITYPVGNDAWVPGGDGGYYCTNDDEGRAIVVDEGGAIVADEGGAIVVDEGGAIVVDEGGAIVADAGGFPPAPGPDGGQLGRDREYEEFECETNDEGGAIVADRAGRVAVTSMPNSFASEQCIRVNGNAVVVNEEGEPIVIDEGGEIVPDEGGASDADETADGDDDQDLPDDAPKSDTDLAYCMVAEADSTPIVIRP